MKPITIQNKSKLYFLADLHLGHTNIIKYSTRPFKDANEMNEAIVAQWNVHIKDDDIVYIPGDLSMHNKSVLEKYIPMLKGNLFVIPGNHDSVKILNKITNITVLNEYVELNVIDSETENGKQLICLMHYPIAKWKNMEYGSWMLHGHTHGGYVNPGASLDTGVDALHRVYPASYDEIKVYLYQKCNTKNFTYDRFKVL